MTTTFNDADHPRDRSGKFAAKAHPEAGVHLSVPRSGPHAEAKTILSQAFTATGTAEVRFETEHAEGPTRVFVGVREVALVHPEKDLGAVLSDAVVAQLRHRGEDVPYRAHDGVSALSTAKAFEAIVDKGTDTARALRADPALEETYRHALTGLARAAASPAGTGTVTSQVLDSDPARIEAAVAAGYAETQQLYQADPDTTGARETRLYGRAIALSQVYSRADSTHEPTLRIFDDELRLGRDFATTKAHVIAEVGEHRLGAAAFIGVAGEQTVQRRQLLAQRR